MLKGGATFQNSFSLSLTKAFSSANRRHRSAPLRGARRYAPGATRPYPRSDPTPKAANHFIILAEYCKMTCHQCSKRLVTKSKEKEIDGSQTSFTAASVIRRAGDLILLRVWAVDLLVLVSRCVLRSLLSGRGRTRTMLPRPAKDSRTRHPAGSASDASSTFPRARRHQACTHCRG